jgi:hypothetical protein
LRIVENILRFYVPVNKVQFVKVAEGLEYLKHDFFDNFFIFRLNLFEGRVVDEFHNKPPHSLFRINVKCLVFDDVRMVQPFHCQKVSLESLKMLFLDDERLYSKELPILSLPAFSHNAVSSFSKFVENLIFLFKKFVIPHSILTKSTAG